MVRRVFVCVVCVFWLSGINAKPRVYSYQIAGINAGQMSVTSADANHTVVDLTFVENPSIDNLREVTVLNRRGVPVAYTSTTYSAGARETFRYERGMARWNAPIHEGETRSTGSLFYFGYQSTAEQLALLVHAAMKQKGARIKLLPFGEANIVMRDRITLERAGEQANVGLYELLGLSPRPMYIWLDENGDLFCANNYSGYAAARSGWVVRQGWEDSLPQLSSIVAGHLSRFLPDKAKLLTHSLPDLTAIKSVNVFDSREARMVPNATVLIYRGVVSAVYQGDVDLDSATLVIDGSGRDAASRAYRHA